MRLFFVEAFRHLSFATSGSLLSTVRLAGLRTASRLHDMILEYFNCSSQLEVPAPPPDPGILVTPARRPGPLPPRPCTGPPAGSCPPSRIPAHLSDHSTPRKPSPLRVHCELFPHDTSGRHQIFMKLDSGRTLTYNIISFPVPSAWVGAQGSACLPNKLHQPHATLVQQLHHRLRSPSRSIRLRGEVGLDQQQRRHRSAVRLGHSGAAAAAAFRYL